MGNSNQHQKKVEGWQWDNNGKKVKYKTKDVITVYDDEEEDTRSQEVNLHKRSTGVFILSEGNSIAPVYQKQEFIKSNQYESTLKKRPATAQPIKRNPNL